MAGENKSPVLRVGRVYRASVVVETPIAAPSVTRIKKQLSDMGFGELEVWDSSEDLPEDWQGKDLEELDGFGQTQYWGRGAWTGPDEKQIPIKGTGWTIVWMYEEPGQEPKEPGEPAPPKPERFEQKPQSSWVKYLPLMAVTASSMLAVTLWVKGSKEK